MIDAFASQPQFHRHLAPVWEALPDELRGRLWRPYRRAQWPGEILDRATVASTVIVAAAADAQRFRRRRLIYVEHGAGQSYGPGRRGVSMSYAGGAGYGNVGLFLSPNEVVADRWRAVYPDAEVAAVGCPALDPWSNYLETSYENPVPPTVAVTWHWDCRLVPETRTALPHYLRWLPDLRALVESHGGRLIGHGHPRLVGMEQVYRRAGIEWVPALDEVYRRADMLLVDNSSVGPEFAALGRQVVWMNAPWYRRDVRHGGRFWDWPKGQFMVDGPEELLAIIPAALEDPPEVKAARAAMVASIYGVMDGKASERAAAAIIAMLWR